MLFIVPYIKRILKPALDLSKDPKVKLPLIYIYERVYFYLVKSFVPNPKFAQIRFHFEMMIIIISMFIIFCFLTRTFLLYIKKYS